MREILFRGKRIDDGEWMLGSLVLAGQEKAWILKSPCTMSMAGREMKTDFDVIAVDPTTIGQYTGLTDKNGTKIFEGDICKWRFKRVWSTEYHVAEVIFRQEKCGWRLNTNGDTDKMRDDIEYEIIGNIHDKEDNKMTKCKYCGSEGMVMERYLQGKSLHRQSTVTVYRVECCGCGHKTLSYKTIEKAKDAWEVKNAIELKVDGVLMKFADMNGFHEYKKHLNDERV